MLFPPRRQQPAGAADAGNSAFLAAVNSLEYAAHNADRLRQVVQDAFTSRLADGEADGAADGAAEGLAALATLSSDFSARAAEATAQLADALNGSPEAACRNATPPRPARAAAAPAAGRAASAASLVVSPAGDDRNAGSAEAPLRSLREAVRRARSIGGARTVVAPRRT